MVTISNVTTIRDLKIKDRDEICKILNGVGMFSNQEIEMAIYIIDYFIEDEDDTEYILKVAVDEHDKVLGYICFCQSDLSNTYWEILWMVVDTNMQHRNIGAVLLKEAEEIAKRNNGVGIILETSSGLDYEPARMFYKKWEYKEICKIKDFYDRGTDKVIYEKRIDKVNNVEQLLSSVISK